MILKQAKQHQHCLTKQSCPGTFLAHFQLASINSNTNVNANPLVDASNGYHTITIAVTRTSSPQHRFTAAVPTFEVAVQIVMSANKESVMSEKALRTGFGQTIVVGYSEPIHSSQCPTFDDFASKVQREWDHQWQRVYSSKPEGILCHVCHAILYTCA